MAEQGKLSTIGTICSGVGNQTFYETSYRALHGSNNAGRVNVAPHLKNSSGGGFVSTPRPALYYRHTLNHENNPHYKLLLCDNCITQSRDHYRPHICSDCSIFLPNVISKARESNVHLLSHSKAAEEKTEYQRSFAPRHLLTQGTQTYVSVGPKPGEKKIYQPFMCRDIKGCTEDPRGGHTTVMRSDYTKPKFLQDTVAVPNLCTQISGGYAHNFTPMGCPKSLPVAPKNAPILTIIGKKEPTGFVHNSRNNQTFPNTPFDCLHFMTHYHSTFCIDADFEKLRCNRWCKYHKL